MLNPFDSQSAAERYAQGRPYFHRHVMQRIKAYLSLREPVLWAMDVGCGTGLSTIALKELATHIVGVDASAAMLALTSPDPHITYVVASAEHLPTCGASFDIMTLSSVFHWLAGAAFLAQARHALTPTGHLVIYDNYFLGQMEGQPAFHAWSRDSLRTRYPSPPRASVEFDADTCARYGFAFLK